MPSFQRCIVGYIEPTVHSIPTFNSELASRKYSLDSSGMFFLIIQFVSIDRVIVVALIAMKSGNSFVTAMNQRHPKNVNVSLM